MIYLLINWLIRAGRDISFLNALRYISVRAALALILSFIIGVLIGKPVISWLRKLKYGQQIRKIDPSEGTPIPDNHLKKQGTPTMGGIIIIVGFIIPVILFCNISLPMINLLLVMTVGLGLVGYRDDYLKITGKSAKGLSGKKKFFWQLVFGAIAGLFMIYKGSDIIYSVVGKTGGAHIAFPFMKNWYPDLGWFFIPYAMIVVTATSNAVNLSDGLDGLAIGTVIVSAAGFGVVAYLVGRPDFSSYLMIPFVPGGGELTIFLAAMIGASAAFLWFNTNPAMVFMGDTGSLVLGGLVGTIALFLKQEILLLIIGGFFVLEALSVIIQVAGFKTRKIRIFKMAPFHHHLELCGWPETRIITRMWIVATILALIGLTTLKLR